MIEVTKLNGKQLYINGDLIERIEAVPDTIVCLTSGRKLIVRESVDEVIEKLTAYRRSIFAISYSPADRIVEQAILQVI